MQEQVIAELIALDRAMQRAVAERDPVAFGKFLTEDYVLVDSRGIEHDKAGVVAECGDPEIHVAVNETSDHSVRIHGDVAIVIATLQQKGTQAGRPFDIPVRFTDTWVRQGGRWLCLSGHSCRLPGKNA
jgi:ketosteroid isomerase-like protein